MIKITNYKSKIILFTLVSMLLIIGVYMLTNSNKNDKSVYAENVYDEKNKVVDCGYNVIDSSYVLKDCYGNVREDFNIWYSYYVSNGKIVFDFNCDYEDKANVYFFCTDDITDYNKFVNERYSGVIAPVIENNPIVGEGPDTSENGKFPYPTYLKERCSHFNYMVGKDTETFKEKQKSVSADEYINGLGLSKGASYVCIDGNFSFNSFPKTKYVFAVAINYVNICCVNHTFTNEYKHWGDMMGVVVRSTSNLCVELNANNEIEDYYVDKMVNAPLSLMSDSERIFVQKCKGCYIEDPNKDLGVVYLNSYTTDKDGKIVPKVEHKRAYSLYVSNKEYCESLFDLNSPNFNRFDYKVTRSQKSVALLGEKPKITSEKTILEPDVEWVNPVTGVSHLSYVFAEYDWDNPLTQNIHINYPTYQGKDICLSVKSNEDAQERILFDLYTKVNKDGRGDYVQWDFSYIQTILNNRVDWNVEFNQNCFFAGDEDTSNFFVNSNFEYELGYYDEIGAYHTYASKDEIIRHRNDNSSHFGVNGKEPTLLRLYFDERNQDEMFNTTLTLYCKIAPDYYYNLQINYKTFEMTPSNNFDLVESWKKVSYNFVDIESGIKRSVVSSVVESANSLTDKDFRPLINGLSGISYFPATPDIENSIKEQLKSLIKIKGVYYSISTDPLVKIQQRELFKEGKEMTSAVGTISLVIEYDIRSFFGIQTEIITDGVKEISYTFVPYDDYNQKIISAKTLLDGFSVDNSHRLESVTINSYFLDVGGCVVDNLNPINNQFALNNKIDFSNGGCCISVIVKVNDEFLINFEFFARYYDENGNVTPFATLQKANNVRVKVSEFSDKEGYVLTAKELHDFLKKDQRYMGYDFGDGELNFMGKRGVGVDKQAVKVLRCENGVFTYDVPYSFRSVVYRNSKGEKSQIAVKMTRYSDWSNAFSGGKEWGVEMLNHKGFSWRLSNADIYPHQLYGLFASVVYESQNKDLTSIFAGIGTDGTICEFTTKEVKGSDIYKFVENNKLGLKITGAVTGFAVGGFVGALAGYVIAGYIIPSAMEIVNGENATYYTHYFYVDGTSDLPYIGDNNGKNADDDGNSFENKVKEVPFLSGVINNGSWKIALGVLAGLVFLPLVIWIVSLIIGLFTKSGKALKNSIMGNDITKNKYRK